MGSNNLYKVENTLRSIAKRYKSVKYSLGLAILFLMMGVSAFSEEVVAQEAVAQQEVMTNEQIASSKENLRNSVGSLQSKIDAARAENEKGLAGLRLELIQLMEQGNQVVKSPWMSWQFGANYMYNKWSGAYKGRGDKSEKYPFEGIYTRSNSAYERSISPTSKQYSSLATAKDRTSASSNNRNGMKSGYGLVTVGQVEEPIVGFDVSAGVRPKQVVKGTISIADKNPMAPEQPEAIRFNTPTISITPPASVSVTAAAPTVNAPTVTVPGVTAPTLPAPVKFSPIDPNIVIPDDPALPKPPTFAVILGADCNVGCGVSQEQTGTFNLSGRAQGNIQTFLHYTWSSGTGAEQNYAFKMYTDTGGNFTVGTDIPHNVNGGHGANTVAGTDIYFNSYNFGDEFSGSILQAQDATPGLDRNRQRFFIGGSRFIESDNVPSSNTIKLPSGYTLNLGGILTLGLVSQGHNTTQLNAGTITDVKEKNDGWITGMPYDTTGDGAGKYLTVYGPDTVKYKVKRSADGYVGYKIAIALVQEDNVQGGKILNDTTGVIDFRGERSIGLYTYLPSKPTNRSMINKGQILLSGAESYGMKFAAQENGSTVDFINDENATISLRKNPNGSDRADNAAAMALMEDPSINGGVKLSAGKAHNKGNINITDVQNSLGAYVNINSDITNDDKGIISVNSNIAKVTSGDQPVNIAMRADTNANAEVINKGKINIDGAYAIGMLASGAKLTNTGTINSTNVKNGTGIVGINGASITNSGTIKVVGTGDTNNIGVFLNTGSTGVIGSGSGTPSIEVSGDNSTGVLVTGKDSGGVASSLVMKGNVKVSGDSISGIIANETSVTLEGNATVTVDNNGAVSSPIGAKGSYGIIVKGSTGKFEGKNTTVDVKITNPESIGLYSEGNLTVNKANIIARNGALNFFANNGKIEVRNGGTTETGQKSLLFYTKGTGKINLSGGTLNATIKGATTPNNRGTAFYYIGTGNTFNKTAIEDYFKNTFGDGTNSTLGNLNLNMDPGSRLFVASNVKMDLSNTSASALTSGLVGGPNITGSNYKTFMLYLSHLTIDNAVNLDNATDPYNDLEIANSSITNENVMSGSKIGQVAIAQENNETNKSLVTLTNNKTIELTGTNSLAMYASNGKIKNSAGASITIGDAGAAIYGKNKGIGDTDIENSGDITVGQNSTGIYAEDYTTTGLENKGTITLAGDNGIGMSYKPNLSSATIVENKGTISGTALKDTGIYVAQDKNSTQYTALNSGNIALGTNGVGIYTDKTGSASTSPILSNTGKITVGDSGIGMYGFEEDTTGDVTAGNGGIGLYSQGGAVNIGSGSTTPTITVGNTNATAVFTTGSGQTVTSTNATYNIGDNSYGFVNTGSGNTLNISGGTAALTDNGVFIYSSDTTGNITSNTKITSTGSNGSNFGIFSAGTVNNTGDITLTNGVGNVGVYAINNGNITNSGNITLGASTSTNRSIGAIANVGTVNNAGNIVVNGQYGIGTYSSGSGSTVNNSGNITLTGDETIGNYGVAGSNINLNSGTVALTGNKSTGYYLDAGTGSTIASGAKINVTGEEANGVYANSGSTLTYSGDTTVDGDAAYGLIVDGGSNVNATGGTLTVKGTSGINGTSSGANANRGSAALVVTSGSNLSGGGLDVTADVAGENSVGVYSAGSLAMNSANISAYDSGVNFFTDGGTISIGNNGGTSTVVTGTGTNKGALLFYTPSGNILLNGTVNATVEGGTKAATRGTAFYYTGGGTLGSVGTYTQLNPTNVATWARNSFGNGSTSTLGNLNLTMNQGSRLFLTEKVNMDLSNTSATNLFSGLTPSERPNITGLGSGYRTFMLYHSHLNVDQAVNLDNANDEYNLMEISSSSITNNNTITGTKSGQIAMAQENDTTLKSAVTLTNNGTINLSGANSAGIYAKNAIINNVNAITVGNSSSGIYGLNNTEVSNTGNITVGNSSTGIFYSDIFKDAVTGVTTVYNTTNGLKNDGIITLNGDDSVGLTYEPGNITGTVTFENSSTGSITSTGDKNVGMFAKLAQNGASYNTVNNGNITLGNSASLSNPNVAMYTNANSTGTNPLQNTGNITVGDNSVGMYGYEENSTGNITVGNGAIGLYSKNGNVNVSGSIATGSSKEPVGVYTVGSGQTITSTGTTFNLGDTSYGFVNVGNGNNITSTGGSATLNNNGVYIYSNDKAGSITNSTNISSTGTDGSNYGIYSSGQADNSGNIDFSNGVGNLGIYMVNGGTGRNSGTITVGASDTSNELYSVGMAAGYIGDTNKGIPKTTGTIENNGTINVNGTYGIGMYGAQSGTTVTNNKDIVLNADNTTGIYVENNAKAVNNGSIRTGASGLSNVTGVVLGPGSTLTNNGTINISGTTSKGALLKGGTIANYGTITVSGAGSKETDSLNSTPTSKKVGPVVINAPAGATSATITNNGVVVTPTLVKTQARNPITVAADSIGLYVNTSGKDYTKSITGLGKLTSKADLIIGAEAAGSTTSKYIQVNDSKMLDPYNNAILSSGVSKWDIYSGSLTWMTTPTLDPGTGKLTNLYMAKIPYTEWAKDKDTYNFTDGLEQRYGVEKLGSRENQVFQKLTSIGNNEEVLLYQAYDEMMGHQYANVQQRVQATGNVLDKEFDYLRSQWQTVSKDSNKVKVFGTRGEYKTDTAGIIDYKNYAYGVAYVHENEDIKMGRGIGWYTGIVQNTFKFKDIGKSREEQLQGKVGIFKSVPFDHNNSLNWTISGDIFVGYNRMHRRYLVVDDIFNAKARYYTYGVGVKNQLTKSFRLSEDFSLSPYIALNLEYGRVGKIRERSGEIRLNVKHNDYISISPEVGAELAFKHYFGRKTLKVGLGVAYENELGRVANGKNKARVAHTNADWFNIRGEKEDRRGNVKFDLNLGLDNQRYGVTANVGYDTKGENIRGGLGLRVIF